MKVLVVDDDVVSRMVLMHLIDSCGEFEIIEAEDGADAWEQLEDGLRPAICFCDLRMPRLSGLELLQNIKADADLKAMPFVLVTSATDLETVTEATRSGAAGYIVKPFQADAVRVHLTAFFEQANTTYAPAAETPAESLRRLGISGERLLTYLSGLETQLRAAASELEALLLRGEQAEVKVRLERLHAGCLTLGLSGAAAALPVSSGPLVGAAVQQAVAEALRAVQHQIGKVKQDGAASA